MKLTEEKWTVLPCGNPKHGPEWECWRVVNERGEVLMRNVSKAVAERYASIPDMASALRGLFAAAKRGLDAEELAAFDVAREVLRRVGVFP